MKEEEKMSRREREKQRQRQEMLAAASSLFSEKGYHNVSMHEIAEQAEFAIGTLYKFFKNKEDLYKALVLDLAGRFHEVVAQALRGPDDEVEKLRRYVRAKGEMFGRNLPFIRLFLAESRGASFNIKAGLDEEIQKGYNDTLEKLAAVFERGIKNKRFKEIAAPFHLAVALDSTVNAFLLLWLETPELRPYPEDPDAILRIFTAGLLEP